MRMLLILALAFVMAACQNEKPSTGAADPASAPKPATTAAAPAAQAAPAVAAPAVAEKTPLTYRPATLTALRTGEGETEIKVAPAREEERAHGPQAFAVSPDGNTLFIADSIRGRILKVDAASKETTVLAADPKLVTIDMLAMAGEMLVAHIALTDQTIGISLDGKVGLREPTGGWRAEAAATGKVDLPGGQRYALGHVSQGNGEIAVFDKGVEKPVEHITVETPAKGRLGSVTLLGRSTDGDLFARIEVLGEDANGALDVKRFVTRIDPAGKKARATVEIPISDEVAPLQDLQVDDNGNIFAMLVQNGQVEVQRWTVE